MSDPHEFEGSAREGGDNGSAVRLEDAPGTRATDDHDEVEASEVSTATSRDADSRETEVHESEDHDASDRETEVDGSEDHDVDDHESEDHQSEDHDADDHESRGHDADDHESQGHDVDDHESEVHESEGHDAGDHDQDVDHDAGGLRSGRGALFAAIGVAAVAVIGVLVLLAAFVWPDFTGPGKPDDTASQAVSALSAKDSAALDKVGCKRSDGKPSIQLPPQILQLIQSATPSTPPRMTLDSEARQTINLTLSAGGQTQSAPVDMVLAVNDGSWCLNNIEAGQ